MNKKLFLIVFILILIFIGNAQSILTYKADLKGRAEITYEEPWKPELDFELAKKYDNVFFYNIIVKNNSNFAYKDWQMKLYNLYYISYTDMLERRKTRLWLDN